MLSELNRSPYKNLKPNDNGNLTVGWWWEAICGSRKGVYDTVVMPLITASFHNRGHKQVSSPLWIRLTPSTLVNKISSTRVRYRAESRDEIRWCTYIENLWIPRMSADQACRTITGADEMNWNEINEMSMERKWNEILWHRKTGETPKNPAQIPFHPPRIQHGVIEKRNRDPSGGRRASNRLTHGDSTCVPGFSPNRYLKW